VRRRPALVAVFLLAAVTLGAIAMWPKDGADVAAQPTTTMVAPTATTAPPKPTFEAADASVSEVPVFAAPGATDPVITLTNPTPEDVPLTLRVKEHGPPGWLEVQYNRRPNGATGWIRTSDVVLRAVQNRIVVSVEAKTLTVYEGSSDKVVFQAPVATGLPRTPTPLGEFYVDIVVKLTRATGVYGPYQLSVAGFSDVLQSFGGGAGQIAIHGTNQPQLIGTDASNGCIRLTNEDVTTLTQYAPSGTPVTIVA
jgi:lipoprotein-anchoring transpeptidase ErfK/SrfK